MKVSMEQSKIKDSTLEIPAKLYRIGDLVNCTPFSRQTIHNYTIMGLIREASWTEGGHRLYDESVFRKLSRIIQLKRTKTLAEIKRILGKEEIATQASMNGNTTSLDNQSIENN
jgi:DNA-binding transcriptional MerR regulator